MHHVSLLAAALCTNEITVRGIGYRGVEARGTAIEVIRRKHILADTVEGFRVVEHVDEMDLIARCFANRIEALKSAMPLQVLVAKRLTQPG